MTKQPEPQYTPQQRERIMTYGKCPQCDAPRFARAVEVKPDTWQLHLVCENGHRQP